MITIEGQTKRGEKVCIDDKFLMNCVFENCEIIFTGGDFGWRDTRFINCRITFEGPATRSINFLKYFGFQISPPAQQPVATTTPGKVN